MESEEYSTMFAKAAEAHKGKVLFATSGIKDGIQERLAEFLGVTEANLPTIRLV